jgi:hypothetical protein
MSITPQEEMRRKWSVAVVGGNTVLSFADWSRTTHPNTADTYHLADSEAPGRPVCGNILTKWVSPMPVTDERRVNCPDCLNLLSKLAEEEGQGVGAPTPRLHTPPRMENDNGHIDGVFIFHDVHIEGCTLEVVPQLSGNVEVTVAYKEDGTPEDGALFTLSLFDRVNLLQALLHEFHYGPEVGGPGDDQD